MLIDGWTLQIYLECHGAEIQSTLNPQLQILYLQIHLLA